MNHTHTHSVEFHEKNLQALVLYMYRTVIPIINLITINVFSKINASVTRLRLEFAYISVVHDGTVTNNIKITILFCVPNG